MMIPQKHMEQKLVFNDEGQDLDEAQIGSVI
jgi:hypothetical protein